VQTYPANEANELKYAEQQKDNTAAPVFARKHIQSSSETKDDI
jgi:hypothetical protein